MLKQLVILTALLMSAMLISVGHGSASALMIRFGSENGLSDTFLGFLTTVTYIGFVAGNYLFGWLLPRISYIRTFSVCASIVTICVLLMPLIPEKAAWIILRFMHGLFFSTTVIICESWLNSTVDNANRGKVHATYIAGTYIAFGGSQYILLLNNEHAFALTAVFIILSLAPICMTRFPEPQFGGGEAETKMSITDAYRIAPISYLAQVGNGLYVGATWLFVSYAKELADSPATASTMAVIFFGSGFLLQLPVGWISDKVRDRRIVMTLVYGASSSLAFMLFFGELLSSGILLILILFFGMISATGFSLNVSYGQDFAGSTRASQYASRLFQPYAFGAIIGPMVAGFLMDSISVTWLFAFISIVCAGITVLTITSRIMPHYVPVKQGGSYEAVNTAYTSIIKETLPQYNEYDIGPEHEDSGTEPAPQYTEYDIGPETDSAPPAEENYDFIGPVLSDDNDIAEFDDTSHWKK